MILFKPEHVAPILSGRKTQTRRMGNKRWNVGAVHQARTRMLDADSTFAHLCIRDVRREVLRQITETDAWAEGYETRADYLAAFRRINRNPPGEQLKFYVWVVEFARENHRREG
jgi:hypothetical protein